MEPLIAPVLDFVCPSSWVSNPEWISRLHSFSTGATPAFSTNRGVHFEPFTVIQKLLCLLFLHPHSLWFTGKQSLNLYGTDKPAKIKCDLIQDYTKLGLKLLDLKGKEQALKASWPIRWRDKDEEPSYIWNCNLNVSDIFKLTNCDTFSVAPSVLAA